MAESGLFRLDHRTVAVIGAGSGIGEAVARGCARQGAYVACLDINADAARAAAAHIKETGGQAEAGALDIRDAAAVDAALDGLARAHNGLDALASTPSINVRKTLLNYTVEEFQRVIDVNLKGNFNVLRAAGRIMVAQKRGSIVLFSSIRSQVVEPGQAVYAATKAGILQLVKTAAAEFGPSGVRVNAVGPGVVETPLTAPIKAKPDWYNAYAAKNVFNRWAHADEMIGPTVFLLSDAASYVTGTLLVADAGWLAVDGRFTPPGM
jgi:NAD(P)-dependent dehydrogenase (short-subunit alcohol dehydrogenase family)